MPPLNNGWPCHVRLLATNCCNKSQATLPPATFRHAIQSYNRTASSILHFFLLTSPTCNKYLRQNTYKTLLVRVFQLITIQKLSFTMLSLICALLVIGQHLALPRADDDNPENKVVDKSISAGGKPSANGLVFPGQHAELHFCQSALAANLCSAKLLARIRYDVE